VQPALMAGCKTGILMTTQPSNIYL